MKKFQISRDIPKDGSGILYVLIMEIDGETVYKVGVTQRRAIEDRVGEILTSFFHKFRYYCYLKPKKFTKVEDVYAKETTMHRALAEFKYEPKKKFDGSTELFTGIDLGILLEIYRKCLEGELYGKVHNPRIEVD